MCCCVADVHPLDYLYEALGSQLEPLQEEEHEAQYILKYISSSLANGTACRPLAVACPPL